VTEPWGTAAVSARPRRLEVAASYDLGVDAYDRLWSPVILPPARAVVDALALRAESLVLDVGAGTGALIPSLAAAAQDVRVVALDASAAMLPLARARAAGRAVRADALALPIRDATADAVVLAFVLFHLNEPGLALAEAARVLRSGGRVGTVTWTRDGGSKAHTAWEETLAQAGVPPLPPRRVDKGLDSRAAIDAHLARAGFESRQVWLEHLTHCWQPETFWQLVTGSGVNRMRLRRATAPAARDALAKARERLAALPPGDFTWWGEVVCAVATRTAR